ncbi:MAG: LysM peptidoglycan-binding domain-containing protein, partial [Myxococcota bacterium]
KDGGRLTVLFRHLVEDGTRVSVHFQFPVGEDAKARLRMPMPPRDTPMTGALGVQAPAGLNVAATGAENAKELTLRDLPPELTDLTSSPLLFGYSFEASPRVDVTVSRHQAVELTSTLIDDMQASSVIIEDGSEITKLKLRLRNNTRQYRSVELPAGAVLTHSLIDGQPLRPAEGANGVLLFPLRQSERIEAGRPMTHTVTSGETLTDIANFYYSDPNQWSNILEYNPEQLGSEWDLAVGQVLRIPAKQGVVVQESSFVIELAYKREHKALGAIGRFSTALPEVNVDVVEVTWHLYLPASLTPMSFDTNLTQYSAIRYEPFRRVREFLRRARWVRNAWAGDRYKSILSQRKIIYQAEAERRSKGKMVLASFPLVGERFRFERILLGRDTPQISATYVTRGLGPPLRWGAMAAAFVLTMLMLSPSRNRRTWIIAGVSLVGLLVAAHFVLGIHRRIVWGADLALIVTWFRLRGGGLWRGLVEVVRSPWLALRWLRIGTVAWLFGIFLLLMIVLEYPLLLSSVALVVMSVWWRRSGSRVQGVAHA